MILQANPGAGFFADEQEFLQEAQRVLASGWYILGEEVERFERNFAAWCGAAHGIGCANGTDAIELCLRALGAGPGKVVFTVSHTAVASVVAIERAGAVPWMVDVEDGTLTMSPDSFEEALLACRSQRPELEPFAVLPVHLYGLPVDMDRILDIAARNGLRVVEDCAQSHGAVYKGRVTGTMGCMASFSLYPTKNLGAFGDAGIVLTNDQSLADAVKELRQYGWRERYISACSGMNSRMDPLQAAFLGVKLKRLHADNARRRQIAAMYDELLAPLVKNGRISLCKGQAHSEHVYHQYVILTDDRDGLQAFCREQGVGTAVHYPMPVHQQPAYLDRQRFPLAGAGLPVTEAAASTVLSLPMYPQLADDDIRRVADVVVAWGR